MWRILTTIMLVTWVVRPMPLSAGSIIIQSLGGQAAAYASVSLAPAGLDDHQLVGSEGATFINCPFPNPQGQWMTRCEVPYQQFVNRFGGSPAGRRLVVSVPEVTPVGSCSVVFGQFGGPNCPANPAPYQSPGGKLYECAFTVPASLETTDIEISVTVTPSPGNFDPGGCNRVVVDPSGTTSTTAPDGASTTTTLPDNVLELFMDAWTVTIADALNPRLEELLGQKIAPGPNDTLIIGPSGGVKGNLKASVTSAGAAPQLATNGARSGGGTKVLVKGKRKFKDSDTQFVELAMKLTRAGRRILKRGEPFAATIEVRFHGPDGDSTRSRAISVPD